MLHSTDNDANQNTPERGGAYRPAAASALAERPARSTFEPAVDADHDRDQLETLANDPNEKELVSIFKLLADETRLRVLMNLMRERELHVSALCDRLDQSQPAVSHHLALLRTAGLIKARRDGKHNFYSVRREHFHQVMGHLFNNMTTEVPPASDALGAKPTDGPS